MIIVVADTSQNSLPAGFPKIYGFFLPPTLTTGDAFCFESPRGHQWPVHPALVRAALAPSRFTGSCAAFNGGDAEHRSFPAGASHQPLHFCDSATDGGLLFARTRSLDQKLAVPTHPHDNSNGQPARSPHPTRPDSRTHVIIKTRIASSAAMDYSASIHDPEHPVDDSPWGNLPSSPSQQSRTGFASNITGLTGEGDAPGSPFGSSNGLQYEGGFGAGDNEYRRPGTASTVSQTTEPPSEEPAPAEPYTENQGFPASHQGPLSPVPQQQQQQQQPPKPAPEQAQRVHEQHQPRKPPPPQFKLQAKITGLERTGRKDPILRFDVHVRLPLA